MTSHVQLQISHLTKRFGKTTVFSGLDMSVNKGEWVGIVGENGSGKSTLVKIIVGLEKYDSGEILLDCREQSTYRERAWFREVQLITQYTRNALDPMKKIRNILREPMDLFGLYDQEQRQEQILRWIGYCNLPETILEKRPLEISGGQYQRICIALSLMVDPKIIICDEAAASLDRINKLRMIQLLREQPETTVLFISHNTGLASEICDRQIALADFKHQHPVPA